MLTCVVTSIPTQLSLLMYSERETDGSVRHVEQVDGAAFVAIACNELQQMKVGANSDSTPAQVAVDGR